MFALHGLKTVWKEEVNFKIEVFITAIVVGMGLYFHLRSWEYALVTISIAMVLCAEIINTAVEDLCDRITTEEDQMIGKIKDISGAFVLVSVVGAMIVGILVFYPHFF